MRLVIVESPFAGATEAIQQRNIQYARACIRHALALGEAPMASHLLYTQPGVLNDKDQYERTWGINAGLHWARAADVSVFYTDLGWSSGMKLGLEHAQRFGRRVEERCLEYPGQLGKYGPKLYSVDWRPF